MDVDTYSRNRANNRSGNWIIWVIIGIIVIVIIVWLISSTSTPRPTLLGTSLTPGQEVPPPPVASPASGSFNAALDSNHSAIAYNGNVANLTGPPTAAHFHLGPPGVAGPIVKDIAISPAVNERGEPIPGSYLMRGLWTANDDQPLNSDLVRALLAGNIYVNVHTPANPDGEVRGQVLRLVK
jgi:hypothetical protein